MREQGLRDLGQSDNSLDLEAMNQLCAGHDAALNDLMARHGARLFGYLMRSLQNDDDAADAAQETFVRVYQNRMRFDQRQRFSTWLYAIATNLARDKIRWRGRHRNVSLDAEAPKSEARLFDTLVEPGLEPSEELERSERVSEIKQALAALPEELRTPLVLSEYENLSHAEIGEILKCSVKAVETRIYRARQQLRVKLSHVVGSDA